jgi:hypothetical protein
MSVFDEGDGKMKRQVVAALISAALGFAALASFVIAQPRKTDDRAIYSSVKELMDAIVDPSADTLWNAVGTIVDKEKGIQELAPKTPEEWQDVRNAAVRIIEGGNLLMMPNRAVAPAGTKSATPGVELEPAEIAALIKNDRRSFDGFARELQALGGEALRAIEAKNVELLMDVGARMDGVCESCHQTFWYPPKAAQSGGQRPTGR